MAADGSCSPCPRPSPKRRPSYCRALGRDVPDPPAAGASGAVWFFCAPAAGQERVVVLEETSGHHFLDACSLCKLRLRRSQDIYMCRGNLPFCSEECREEWMEEVEEAREEEERSHYRSISNRAAAAAGSRRKEHQGQKEAPSRVFHASEAVAAS